MSLIRSKSKRSVVLSILLLSLIVTISLISVRASAEETIGGDDFSLFLGEMLPTQIDGVRDILPVFGGRYAFALSGPGAIELGLQNSHAQGVDFTTLDLDFRYQVLVAPGISALAYLGPAFNYYSPKDGTVRMGETGIELGIAGLMHIGDVLAFRGDLKFMGGPGTSLYLLFGVMIRTSSSGQ